MKIISIILIFISTNIFAQRLYTFTGSHSGILNKREIIVYLEPGLLMQQDFYDDRIQYDLLTGFGFRGGIGTVLEIPIDIGIFLNLYTNSIAVFGGLQTYNTPHLEIRAQFFKSGNEKFSGAVGFALGTYWGYYKPNVNKSIILNAPIYLYYHFNKNWNLYLNPKLVKFPSPEEYPGRVFPDNRVFGDLIGSSVGIGGGRRKFGLSLRLTYLISISEAQVVYDNQIVKSIYNHDAFGIDFGINYIISKPKD